MTNKKLIVLVLMAMFMLPSVQMMAVPEDVPLEGGIVDPSDPQDDPHRTPVEVPRISIEDYTLYFNTPCDGYVLRLVDEFDNVAYSTVIPVGATSLVLPSYLSSTYELQIITSIYYFYGDITL